MPRTRQISRDEVPEDFQEIFERLFPGGRDPRVEPGTSTGTPGDWWTTMALVPEVMRAYWTSYQEAAKTEAIDPALREIGVMRSGFNSQSQFVFSQHCKAARSVGVSEAKIEAIPSWGSSDAFTPLERAVLAYADDLTLQDGRVQDGTFAALQAELTDEAILQLTWIVLGFQFYALLSRSLRMEFDNVPERVQEIPMPSGSGN
jgi:alkylhydroperoxidase family enzyme